MLRGLSISGQIDDLRRDVIATGAHHDISGRAMARLTGIPEKKLRGFPGEGWTEDHLDHLFMVEDALMRLGLMSGSPHGPMDTVETGDGKERHLKARMPDSAASIDRQLSYVHSYLHSVGSAGIIREGDIRTRHLRVKAPDCALHFYEIDGDADHLIVSEWQPVADYMQGRDLNGSDIMADMPRSVRECIRDDVLAAIRSPGRSHWTMVHRGYSPDNSTLPSRNFLRLIKFIVGDRDVPKVVIARALQPVSAAAQYLKGLCEVGPREV